VAGSASMGSNAAGPNTWYAPPSAGVPPGIGSDSTYAASPVSAGSTTVLLRSAPFRFVPLRFEQKIMTLLWPCTILVQSNFSLNATN
jgi:hypothetical protein